MYTWHNVGLILLPLKPIVKFPLTSMVAGVGPFMPCNRVSFGIKLVFSLLSASAFCEDGGNEALEVFESRKAKAEQQSTSWH